MPDQKHLVSQQDRDVGCGYFRVHSIGWTPSVWLFHNLRGHQRHARQVTFTCTTDVTRIQAQNLCPSVLTLYRAKHGLSPSQLVPPTITKPLLPCPPLVFIPLQRWQSSAMSPRIRSRRAQVF
jgi:hypothetical protein